MYWRRDELRPRRKDAVTKWDHDEFTQRRIVPDELFRDNCSRRTNAEPKFYPITQFNLYCTNLCIVTVVKKIQSCVLKLWPVAYHYFQTEFIDIYNQKNFWLMKANLYCSGKIKSRKIEVRKLISIRKSFIKRGIWDFVNYFTNAYIKI